ncbi:unnamed protein product [Effrenium voratum]|nr:unnamed protein product [Effrenium voratum]
MDDGTEGEDHPLLPSQRQRVWPRRAFGFALLTATLAAWRPAALEQAEAGQLPAAKVANVSFIELRQTGLSGCPFRCGDWVPCLPGLIKLTSTTTSSSTSTTTSSSSSSTSSSTSSSSSSTTSSTTTSSSTTSSSSSTSTTTSSTTITTTTSTPGNTSTTTTTSTTSSSSSSSTTTSTSSSSTTSTTSSTSTSSSSSSSSSTSSSTSRTFPTVTSTSTSSSSSTTSTSSSTSSSSTSSSSTSSSSTSSTTSSTTSTTTTPFICSDGCQIPLHWLNDQFCDCSDCGDELAWTCATCGAQPDDAQKIGIAVGTSMTAAIGIALGVSLGLTTALAAVFLATGSFTLAVPDAEAFQENEEAVAALKRTVAQIAGPERDEADVTLILPCADAHRRLRRRLDDSLGVCFKIKVKGQEASSSVCQRLTGVGSSAAQRILTQELSSVPNTGGVRIISFEASPNPVANNPTMNSGADDFFDPTQAGVSLGAAPR